MGSTKERIARSKRASAGSLAAIVGYPQVARTCMLQAGVVLSFSGIPFVSFCFTFICVLFSFLVLSFFVSMEMSLLPFFCTITVFSLYGSTSYVFPFRMVFFYRVITGWLFDISFLCESSTNQSTKRSVFLE